MVLKQSTPGGDSLLKIGQVARLTGVPIYTLRYWERIFPGVLNPLRTPGGQRRYDRENLQVIYRIKELLKEKMYSLAGARRILHEEMGQGNEGE